MNRIGIIAAMQEECEAIINIMEEIKEKEISRITFYEGKINNKNIILVKCGIGKVNAARVTQILIDNYKIEYVVNIGSAGALNPSLEIGDIVVANKLIQHDFDITAFGHTKGYITGVGDYIYCDDKLVTDIKKAFSNIDLKECKIVDGIIASGDIFCTNVLMKEKIYSKFNADCVEMEGAAIAQVCYLDNVPFVVIRSISDSPNGKNAMVFDKFVRLAANRCAEFLKSYI